MKIVTTTNYVAFDGVPHPTEAECRAYEKRLAHIRLVGLTIEQVEAALSRTDPELADAIEVIGSRIARARLADGDRKHERKSAPKPGEAPATNGAAADEGDETRADEAAA